MGEKDKLVPGGKWLGSSLTLLGSDGD